jgi:chromosome segregation ATPase
MDIMELLKQYGVELEADKVDEFNKSFRKSYKSDAELRKVTEKVTALESELGSTKTELESTKSELGTITQSKSSLDTELSALKQAQAEEQTKSLYENAFKGVEFVSDRVKKSVLDELKSKGLEAKDGKLEGVDTFLQELYTSDKAIFKTVDSAIHTWSGAGNGDGDNKQKTTVDTSVFGRIL